MLDDARAGDRQMTSELARSTRRARQALENNHADRVTEQREQAQDLSGLRRPRTGFGHFEVSRRANSFDNHIPCLLYSNDAFEGAER